MPESELGGKEKSTPSGLFVKNKQMQIEFEEDGAGPNGKDTGEGVSVSSGEGRQRFAYSPEKLNELK